MFAPMFGACSLFGQLSIVVKMFSCFIVFFNNVCAGVFYYNILLYAIRNLLFMLLEITKAPFFWVSGE